MTGLERCCQFVDSVILGEIQAPITVKQACERFCRDDKNPLFDFDNKAANNAVWQIERLPHTKGPWQRKPFILEPFQCFVVCNLFGWKWKGTNKRRFSYCYLQFPRKNGKTQLAVAIALVMFGPDHEPGAEILLGATSLDHARDLLFRPAKFMTNNCSEYREENGIEVNATTLVIPRNDSVLKTVIKKPDDGTSPYCAIVDEYHLHETSDMWSVFDTGTGARPDGSLLMTTSTAGFTLGGPCHQYRDDMLKLLRGDYEDETTFTLIYEPDEGDAWDDIEVLRKVNPTIGVIQDESHLVNKLNAARRSAEKQNDFRTKHLSQWVGAKTAYLNMVAWQRQGCDLTIDDFAGEPCHVAVDLSTQKDATSVGAMFQRDGKYYYFAEHFVPEGAFEWNDRYKTFDLGGHINVSEGNAQDYDAIEGHIHHLAENHTILSVRFDPWQAAEMMQRLMKTGLTVYKQTQQFSDFSDPMKTVETAVLDGDLFHGRDPVLTYMVGNTSAIISKDGHMKPVKGNKNSPTCVIDGCVAMIMCMKGYQDEPTGSLDEWLSNPVAIS